MTISTNITKRVRRRVLTDGTAVRQTRYVLQFREPRTSRRRQLFFAARADAIAKRDELVTSVATQAYSAATARTRMTVADAVTRWLDSRQGEVKPGTWKGYKAHAKYVTGPLLAGTARQRRLFTMNGEKPLEGVRFLDMLGQVRLSDLTTAQIREWHRTLTGQVSSHTANVAKGLLRWALALAAEDFQQRVPPMPLNLTRGKPKTKKAILTPEQVGRLIDAARRDKQRGVYYAFPWLTGTRPSEQLGLLWEDLDLDAGVIRIRRMQERLGAICDVTKTVAGRRDIPMSPLLKTMLLEWRAACPRLKGKLHRVFPATGHVRPWSGTRRLGGGPLHYANFRKRFWEPMFKKLGLPYVTPHSARHAFISTLQAKGVEIGLVAKLAGHSNPAVTLGHYTQAVRPGDAATMLALEEAYAVAAPPG